MNTVLMTSGRGTVLSRLSAQVIGWISSHPDWKRNRFPFAGGLYDQPARWVQAMRILDSVEAHIERTNRAVEEAKRKAKAGV